MIALGALSRVPDVARPARARAPVQGPGRRHRAAQPRPAPARAGRRRPRERRAAADLRVRRRRLRRRRGAGRGARPRARVDPPLPAAAGRASSAGCWSTAATASWHRPRSDSATTPRATSRRRGIEIRLGTQARVARRAAAPTFSDGSRVETASLVWAAGVEANPLVRELGLPVDDHGRVLRRRTPAGEGHGARVGARRLRRGAERRHAGHLRPRDLPARAAAGAAAHARTCAAREKPYRYRTLGQVASLGQPPRHRAARPACG